MIRIAVFASGNGSNAINLYNYFKNHPEISFHKIYCNNPNAGIVAKAAELNIPLTLFSREEWNAESMPEDIKKDKIDYIILAGFLWLVPQKLIQYYPLHILNIYFSLLPKYGGKGMYGAKVHQAIIEHKEKESGISIHLVNEIYDKGTVLFQATTEVSETETAESLAQKIHALEHEHFPVVVEAYISECNKKGP